MTKIKKILIASCLLCATLAIGAVVAFADVGTPSTSQAVSSSGKKNFNYLPDIAVDWGEYSEDNIPDAVIGEPYRLFTATAEDAYSDALGVTTKAYLHYSESTKSIVTISDGCITPKYYGIYTVEYTAMDMFGNKSVYTYDFSCYDTKTLSIELSGIQTQALAGEETPIASYNYFDNIGFVNGKITATHTGGKAVYDLSDKTSFIPMYSGEYTIEYELTDYNVTAKDSYTLTVSNNPKPVFLSDAAMPKYFIVGREYDLPRAETYLFATGSPVSVTPVVSVKYGKGKAVDLKGYAFTPTTEGEITFTYTAKNGSNSETREYKAQVIDVGEDGTTFDITKFFYSTNARITAEKKSLKIKTSTEGATVEFINALPAHGFSVNLFASQTSNFDTLNIYLTDSADKNVSLKISYINFGADSHILINDDEDEDYKTGSFEYDSQTITYSDVTKAIDFNNEVFTDTPKGFEGFPSGTINVTFEFVGVRTGAELELFRLNNQTLSYTKSDIFAPQFWFEVSSRETYRINDEVSLGHIYYGDVLDSSSAVYITITSPSGEFVTSTSGNILNKYVGRAEDCNFRVTEYGDYMIRYTVTDSNDNDKTYGYSISVKDIVAPTAELVSDMPEKVKAGEAFTLSEIAYEDDVSKAENCVVTVILIGGPVGDVKTLEAGKTYNFNTKGSYYLYYIVADEANNTVVLCHRFIVE